MTAVPPMTAADWEEFATLISEDTSNSSVWYCAADGADCKVWKRPDEKAPINLVRLWAVIPDVDAKLLYEMLNNHAYRKVWDENMIEGKVIQMITPVDEVGYYAAKAPSPISNRDFVTHRTFRAFADQNKYVIFNKSAEHPDMPDDPNFVRGWSFRTGYQICKHERGCTLEYMTQSDPRGWIPKWLTNTVTSKMAPSIIEKMSKAALNYEQWKLENPTDAEVGMYAFVDDSHYPK